MGRTIPLPDFFERLDELDDGWRRRVDAAARAAWSCATSRR
jgi:hypothetical protein